MGTVSGRWTANECLTLYSTSSVSDSLFLTVQNGNQVGYAINTEHAQLKNCTTSATTFITTNQMTTAPSTTTTTTKATTTLPITRHTMTVSSTNSVACPNGYISLTTGCYKFRVNSKDESTWSHAKSYCQNHNGNLAIIVSQAEQDAISHYLTINGQFHRYWIAGTDQRSEGSWEWVYPGGASVSLQRGYTNWGLHQSHNSNEDCLALYGHDGFKWHDSDCNDHLRFVCETAQSHHTSIIG